MKVTMRFNAGVCGRLDEALRREWIETNGLGGFASSTIAGMNTRRYHGLLTAALKPPVFRFVLLSKFEESLIVGDERFELAVNRYPGVVHPKGFEYLQEFRLDPWPVYVFRAGGVTLEKSVFLVHGENTVAVEYALRTPLDNVTIELRPMLAYRDYHSMTHANPAIREGFTEERPGLLSIAPYDGLPVLYFAHNAADVEATGYWFYNFEYDAELERGLDFREDLFNPFVAAFGLDQPARVIVSLGQRTATQYEALRQAEAERRTAVRARAPVGDPLVSTLTAAADQYIVRRGSGQTVIAGYHWFTDWGRDTLIALPGLTLPAGQFDTARNILSEFARHVDRGMLPNRFPDGVETLEYNAVDSTLWLFEAVRAFLEYTGDFGFVRDSLYRTLRDIIEWHVRGTRFGIHMDSDGLLAAGVPGLQLTWMDSKVGDWVVTPRHGKPVEIQALWHNALCVIADLAGQFGAAEEAARFLEMGQNAAASFNAQFWNEENESLYDVVDGDFRDGSIRPNQILAVSLRYSMLGAERARKVVDMVQRELLTPLGLRTLAPSDPRYRGTYLGGMPARDAMYHQGPVWPWLMGPFIRAYIKVHGRTEAARLQARDWLSAFERHLEDAGLGHISEICDGDAPYTPRGCIAQAWSVAEVLRAAVEDVYDIRPRP